MSKVHKKNYSNADIIREDNGKCVLNNALFDGIPQGALVNIQLIRGNIDIEGKIIYEDGKEEYFVFGYC